MIAISSESFQPTPSLRTTFRGDYLFLLFFYAMRLLSLVGFSTAILATKKIEQKMEDFGISRDEDGFLNCQNCSRRFFTKIGFENHSTYEHRNDAETQVGQLPRTPTKRMKVPHKKMPYLKRNVLCETYTWTVT